MIPRENLRQTLIELIENDIGQRFDWLEDSQNLRTELGLDSVDVVSIVSQVERRFRIRLTHEELQQVVTVGHFLDLLESKLQNPPHCAAA